MYVYVCSIRNDSTLCKQENLILPINYSTHNIVGYLIPPEDNTKFMLGFNVWRAKSDFKH